MIVLGPLKDSPTHPASSTWQIDPKFDDVYDIYIDTGGGLCQQLKPLPNCFLKTMSDSKTTCIMSPEPVGPLVVCGASEVRQEISSEAAHL